jgi:hypothetical protein
MTNREFADSLRKVADFYEANPDFPQFLDEINVFERGGREALARQARCFGHCEKDVDDVWFMVKRDFGQIRLVLNAYRDKVCERVLVRTEEVPEHIIPAIAEEIVPAHKKEIYEWKCPDSLLNTTAV